jgi:hypothetical protein
MLHRFNCVCLLLVILVHIASSVNTLSPKLTNHKMATPSFPSWFNTLAAKEGTTLISASMPEWSDPAVRVASGYKGTDYVHSERSGVRVLDYVLQTNEAGQLQLVGVAVFTPAAESHKGLCHGGSMCAILDDVIGWLGFCQSGICRPWSGFTVQVNSGLKKPVAVGSVLKLEVC